MKIRCKACGEFFSPDKETDELISEGLITSESANICDDCWDMLNVLYTSPEDMDRDANPGF